MPDLHNSINFTRFVSVGDSITAGYADGALYYDGQLNTYPNLIAQQYRLLFPVQFKQPLVDTLSAGIGFLGKSRLILKPYINSSNLKSVQLAYSAKEGDSSVFTENTYIKTGPFNNMAVPGGKLTHLLLPGYGNPKAGEGNYNSFFTRMCSNPEKASILSDVMQQDPTFFSLYIGNNDVLAYAMCGGTCDSITPLNGKAGEGFINTFNYLVEQLTSKGAKGILATIPNITTIPFFNTIPYNSLLLSKNEADHLNLVYNSGQFTEGSNQYMIEDLLNGKPIIRLITKKELIVSDIILDPLKDKYLKGLLPIPKNYTLTIEQINEVQETIQHYNSIIQSAANDKKLALVNLNKLLKNSKSDRFYDSRALTIVYKQNGFFSLDGMHINSLGQAVLANEFIKAIQKTYKLKIPRVPIFKFRKKQRI